MMGIFNWGEAVESAGAGVKDAFDGIGDSVSDIIDSSKGQIPPEYQGKIDLLETELKGKLKQAEIDADIKIREIMAETQQSVYSFALQYEGSADQVPKWITVFRSLIRPITTVLMVGSFLFFMLSDVTAESEWMMTLPSEYWWMLGIVLTFWFGGKIGENIVDKIKS